MQGASIVDDLSSDVSPHVATPSSSSASYEHSPRHAGARSAAAITSSLSSNLLNTPSASFSKASRDSTPAAGYKTSHKPVGSSHGDALVDPSHYEQEEDEDGDFEAWDDLEGDAAMDGATGLNGTAQDGDRLSQPLLGKEDRGRPSYDAPGGSARPPFHARRSTFRSRSPDYQAATDNKKKWTYAAFFLGLSLVSFVIQTETAVYIQHDLGWNKAYCMLWLTHGSWSLLWPVTFGILRLQKRSIPFDTVWKNHKRLLRTTAQMVRSQKLHLSPKDASIPPIPYMLKTTAFVTTALTIAGGSWYVAVDLTTASDLTAIYNCSAFFAYAFSIPLLGDKLRMTKILSVGIAIVGVLIVAYGDAKSTTEGAEEDKEASNRLLGNIIIGIGSVLYGLYEVLYKKYACPPDGTSPGRGMIFAMTFGSLIGSFTLLVLWIPLPILHFTGLETFQIPTGEAAWMLAISVLMNATFSGSFLVLISLTSPVLSSVAALLTIFLVAITSWLIDGVALTWAAIFGGLLIIGAFLMLSWDTYREMGEEQRRRELENEVEDTDLED